MQKIEVQEKQGVEENKKKTRVSEGCFQGEKKEDQEKKIQKRKDPSRVHRGPFYRGYAG